MNTLSEIEEYYKTREQQLLKKIHQQEAALTAAEQTLKQLIKSQKAQLDETNQLHATQERAFKEELYRDSLTGAYNRRYYEEVVRKSIGPAGIALLDVDDFKICNDAYGHYAGDMALITVVEVIRQYIRKTDKLIRYGGDEFVICGEWKNRAELEQCIASIQKRVDSFNMEKERNYKLSLSVGAALWSECADSEASIVELADRSMYKQKQIHKERRNAGSEQYCIYSG